MSCSDYSDLPFIPSFSSSPLRNHPDIQINFFEPKFSQSYYNHERSYNSSNACTLIAVLMASYCNHQRMIINKPDKSLDQRLVYLLAYSILDGNKIHESLKSKGALDDYNLTVPEAVKFASYRADGLVEWKSMIYMESLFQTLHINLRSQLNEWAKFKKNRGCDLYVVLIADNRSILFIFQKETVSLVDSHQHSDEKGALIAIGLLDRLNILCMWYNSIINSCYHVDPTLYELTFLYFPKKELNKKKS